MIKDKNDLFNELQQATNSYVYANEDRDFEIVIKLTCRNGWVDVKEIKEETNENNKRQTHISV